MSFFSLKFIDAEQYTLHVTLCPARLKKLRPIWIIVTFEQVFKAANRNFFCFWLKMIRNQHLRKYITSQCSKLLPYFSPIHNG